MDAEQLFALSGNAITLDLIKRLQWVRNNIQALMCDCRCNFAIASITVLALYLDGTIAKLYWYCPGKTPPSRDEVECQEEAVRNGD